jgi:hypothetical protein
MSMLQKRIIFLSLMDGSVLSQLQNGSETFQTLYRKRSETFQTYCGVQYAKTGASNNAWNFQRY